MVVVTVLCILLSIFLNKTKQGVIPRAVSQDRKAAAMVGIDVSGATLMGNVLGCGIGGGHGVAPGAERNQQVPVFVKGKVAVHHGGNTDAAHDRKCCAVLCLHGGHQRRIGGLHTLPDFFQGVCPDAVLQAVFSSELALRKGGALHQPKLP